MRNELSGTCWGELPRPLEIPAFMEPDAVRQAQWNANYTEALMERNAHRKAAGIRRAYVAPIRERQAWCKFLFWSVALVGFFAFVAWLEVNL